MSNNELDDYGFHIRSAMRNLESLRSSLGQYINKIEEDDFHIDFEGYDNIRTEASYAIGVTRNIVESLKILSHVVPNPESRQILGAELKPRIFLDAKVKDDFVINLLIVANQILQSDFNTVSNLTVEIVEILKKYMEKENQS